MGPKIGRTIYLLQPTEGSEGLQYQTPLDVDTLQST